MIANANQIRAIHVLKNRLGIDEDAYRSMLVGYGVTSSKQLTDAGADDLINKLRSTSWSGKPGHANGGRVYGRAKYECLARRQGFASPAQLRMIDAMWKGVARQESYDDLTRSLNRFVKRIAGVDAVEWLSPLDVRKVVRAIESMKKQKGGLACQLK